MVLSKELEEKIDSFYRLDNANVLLDSSRSREIITELLTAYTNLQADWAKQYDKRIKAEALIESLKSPLKQILEWQ